MWWKEAQSADLWWFIRISFCKARTRSAQSAVVKFCVNMLTHTQKNALKSSEVADKVKVIVLDS